MMGKMYQFYRLLYSSSSLRLGRWPVIPVRLSISSSVALFFPSLQGSRHVLSLPVHLLPFSICACSIRLFSFVPTMSFLYPTCFPYTFVSHSIPPCFVYNSSQCFHFSYFQYLHSPCCISSSFGCIS